MQELKKIVVIGPESTGKSSLCELLAKHFKTFWVPEFAREYLLTNGTNYTYDNLLTIAKGQVALEDEYIGKSIKRFEVKNQDFENPMLFVDTDMYVMKVWCEYVFGKCHAYIEDKITERKADFYLLCNVDLPWAQDELREYPDLETRKELYEIYKNILINQSVPWAVISGNYEERLQTAINTINNAFT
ncbi:AAA family ATPase [Segetibacter koreensis]|uniref:AAA family ATPase n=1 Tax=Segetibacter koreensis TaxID=398037 RepID=UPI00035D5CAD|nr:ATP-binding protein [Segetibacter koreensis]